MLSQSLCHRVTASEEVNQTCSKGGDIYQGNRQIRELKAVTSCNSTKNLIMCMEVHVMVGIKV